MHDTLLLITGMFIGAIAATTAWASGTAYKIYRKILDD